MEYGSCRPCNQNKCDDITYIFCACILFYSQFPGFEGLCKFSNTPQRGQIQGHGFDASFVLVRKEKSSKKRETSQDVGTKYIHHFQTANKLKALKAQHIPPPKVSAISHGRCEKQPHLAFPKSGLRFQ